jgi:hypothetical protein
MHFHWPDATTTQFVPQLMRGLVFDDCDAQYKCTDTWQDGWVIQAEYIAFVNGSAYGVTGDIVPVSEGDLIKTHIYYGSDHAGTYSYCGQISSGGNTSQVVVTHPFLGKNPNYPDAFGTHNPLYYQFQLGDLWESWGMDYACGYPSDFSWNVTWKGDAHLGFKPLNDPAMPGAKAAVVTQSAGHAFGTLGK